VQPPKRATPLRILLQRVSEAQVRWEEDQTPMMGAGLMCLVGFRDGDSVESLEPMAEKLLNLRVFEDDAGRMNLSLLDKGLSLALVPQFTLYADCRKGRRPGFSDALAPEAASGLFDHFTRICGQRIQAMILGRFGTDMQVHLINDGPVTMMLDSDSLGISPRNHAAPNHGS